MGEYSRWPCCLIKIPNWKLPCREIKQGIQKQVWVEKPFRHPGKTFLFFCHLNNNSYEASSNTSIIQICCGVEHCPEGVIKKKKFKAFTSRVARGSHLLKNIICFVGLLHCWVILLTYKLDEIASWTAIQSSVNKAACRLHGAVTNMNW